MGTRCLTFVYDGVEPVINMYRQYDGYPEGHGAELAEFLQSGQISNGLRLGETEKFFNGVGCMAAQLVAHFKQSSGGFYLYPASAIDCGQDYEYHIQQVNGKFHIRVVYCGCNFFGTTQSDTYEKIFDGFLNEFVEFCKEKEAA